MITHVWFCLSWILDFQIITGYPAFLDDIQDPSLAVYPIAGPTEQSKEYLGSLRKYILTLALEEINKQKEHKNSGIAGVRDIYNS